MRDYVEEKMRQWQAVLPEAATPASELSKRLAVASTSMAMAGEAALREHGLSLFEYDLLSTMFEQGEPYELSHEALSKRLIMEPGLLDRHLAALEERGLLERVSGDEQLAIQLTGRGQDLTRDAVLSHIGAMEALFAPLSAGHVEGLIGALRELNGAMPQRPR